jgi:hypothetical protein
MKVWYYGTDWKVSALCQTVILERKVPIQGCYLLRECLDTVSEIHPTCQCVHTLMAHCPFKRLAIICFDCTLHGTARDAAAPLTVAPGFKAFKSTHPHPIPSHPTTWDGYPGSTNVLRSGLKFMANIRTQETTKVWNNAVGVTLNVQAVQSCPGHCRISITRQFALRKANQQYHLL